MVAPGNTGNESLASRSTSPVEPSITSPAGSNVNAPPGNVIVGVGSDPLGQ